MSNSAIQIYHIPNIFINQEIIYTYFFQILPGLNVPGIQQITADPNEILKVLRGTHISVFAIVMNNAQ